MPWPGWEQPFSGELNGATSLASTDLPGLNFSFHANRWVTIGERPGRPYYRLDLPEGNYRKLYLLLATFSDNHDLYSRLGHITVRGDQNVLASRDIYMPGDVDWWDAKGWANSMDILRDGRPDRLGMMPFMEPQHSLFNDTSEGNAWMPPVFPNHQHWSSARYIRTDTTNFNIVEIDLGSARPARNLAIQTDGISPGFALLAVTAEMAGDTGPLEGSPFQPPGAHRPPHVIFTFSSPMDAAGWTFEGNAFLVSPAFGLPYSMNSLDANGETATGRALSPSFTIDPNFNDLVLEVRGGITDIINGEPNLAAHLVDAHTGERLGTVHAPGSHIIEERIIPLTGLANRQVRLELIDNKTATSYAWIGLVSAWATLLQK